MSKTIPFKNSYKLASGYSFKSIELDDNGETVWEKAPDPAAPAGTVAAVGTPKYREGNTYDLIREAMNALQNFTSIHKPVDKNRIWGMFLQVEEAEERHDKLVSDMAKAKMGSTEELEKASAIELGDKSYQWLHDVLERLIPVETLYKDAEQGKTAKTRGDDAPTFAWILWHSNSAYLINELRDRTDSKYVDSAKGEVQGMTD